MYVGIYYLYFVKKHNFIGHLLNIVQSKFVLVSSFIYFGSRVDFPSFLNQFKSPFGRYFKWFCLISYFLFKRVSVCLIKLKL